MRRGCIVSFILASSLTAAAWANPTTIEFSPAAGGGGRWAYDPASHTLSLCPLLSVDRINGASEDALIGTEVILPSMNVTGSSGVYTLTPLGTPTVEIRGPGSLTYLTGTLGGADMFTAGTIAMAYSEFKMDITNVVVTPAGQALGSQALDAIAHMPQPSLDFDLSLNGGRGPSFNTFAKMIDGGFTGEGDLSGTMFADVIPVPAPAAVFLVSMGFGAMGILRRRVVL